MLRVKDPQASLKFYTEVSLLSPLASLFRSSRQATDPRHGPRCQSVHLTLSPLALTHTNSSSENEFETFTLYFLAFDHGSPTTPENRFAREGILELTHNHGTESDPSFPGYASGNSEPGRGFGHIAITVDDIEAACARFETLGVRFQKKLTDGKMKHIAFILDPDGSVPSAFSCPDVRCG